MLAVIQNDPDVPAGTLSTLLAECGEREELCPAYAGAPLPDPARLRGAVVLGGAMGVHQEELHPHLKAVRLFMAEALRLRIPLLGICLGGQLLADLLGGSVRASSPYGEKGLLPVLLTTAGEGDPLFAGVPSSFTTFQWHDDSFLPPDGAVLIASSAACPWQAFRYESAVGVQFHPEVTPQIVAAWCQSTPGAEHHLSLFQKERQLFDLHNRTLLSNFIRQTLTATLP